VAGDAVTEYAVLVIAKAPVPGRVKTRLQPQFSAMESAQLATAALQDTLAVAQKATWLGVALDLCGLARVPRWIPGNVFPQATGTLGARLDASLVYSRSRTALPLVLLGMDTPQVSTSDLAEVLTGLARSDFVLGPAMDGGFWTFAANGAIPPVFSDVPMSQPESGQMSLAALKQHGSVTIGPSLEDIDDSDSALRVARLIPDSRYARLYWQLMAAKSP
jgi:glycosyltransferase A (GT-A) superfamily protein (DUF2064 family)